jgi:charged multivesicular body protein 1
MGNKVSLEDEMVNLRIVSKQMQRSSKKCEKNEKAALQKLKKVSHSVLAMIVFPGHV